MVQKPATLTREISTVAPAGSVKCRHYWIIDMPDGRISKGECSLCGEQRGFPNYLSDCLADNDQEKFEEWLSRQGRKKKAKGKYNSDVLSVPEEGV